jgi:hypothetical protein
VVDAAGIEDVDIRNFAAPFPNEELIAPPYQRNPEPLPLTGSAAKPDELNFEGHTHGWDGDDDVNHKLMYRTLEIVDAIGLSGVLGPATSTLNTIPSWANTSGTLLKNNSQVVIPTNGVIGLGSNPSTGGALRLTNDESIAWRGSGSFNLQVIVLDSSDNIVIGTNAAQQDDIILDVATGNSVLCRVNAVTELTVAGSLVSVTDSLAIGTTPATGGVLRLPNDEGIAWRGSGSFNLQGIVLDSSDDIVIGANAAQQNDVILDVATGQAIYSRVNATPELVVLGGKVTVSTALGIGPTVPAAGAMRVETGFNLRGRDNANGGDVDVLTWTTADIVQLGDDDADLEGVEIAVPTGKTIDLSVASADKMVVRSAYIAANVPLQLPSYTVAGVPSASPAAQMIYVSDETGGAVPAFSDGTNWRRVTDRAIVS